MKFDYTKCKQYTQYDELFKNIYDMSAVSVKFIDQIFFNSRYGIRFYIDKNTNNQFGMNFYRDKSISHLEFLISDAKPTLDYFKLNEPLQIECLLKLLMSLSCDKVIQGYKKIILQLKLKR